MTVKSGMLTYAQCYAFCQSRQSKPPSYIAFILEHSGKFIYPRYTKWHNDYETKKARKLHFGCHGHTPLGLHRTQFHLSSDSMKEHYFPRKYLCCSISLRLSNSTICAWPQCLCCAYFQKPRYPSLHWLFSIMHHLVSPTYKYVQRMSKAR